MCNVDNDVVLHNGIRMPRLGLGKTYNSVELYLLGDLNLTIKR